MTRRPDLQHVIAGSGRRRLLAALALLVPVAVVVGIVVGVGSSAPSSTAGDSSGLSDATTVQRRNLVETDTESGTVSFSDPQAVYDRSNGTITWLPSIGQVVTPGQTLFKVDARPVILMNGTAPAYRDLAPSDTAGRDILQLNRNLVKLGFNPDGIVIDDEWQAATTAGVDALEASLGETETGSLSLGQIVFLPGTQLVSAVDASLGSTGASSGQGNLASLSSTSDSVAAGVPEFVSLVTTKATPAPPMASTPTTTTGSTTTTTGTTATTTTPREPSKTRHPHKPRADTSLRTLEALIALLRARITELRGGNNHPSTTPQSRSSHANNSSYPNDSGGASTSSNSDRGNPSSSGSGGASASAVLQTSSTRLIVTVDLDPSKQSEAEVGEPVTVEMPAGNTVDGTISGVSPVAQSSSSSGNATGNGSGNGNGSNSSSATTIPVTIELKGHVRGAGLDQATVSVNFAQARARNVLSVPVTALLATSGGGYAVQEDAAPHNLIPVTTGLFAAGYVQISGSGIYSGLQVTDSQG